MSITNKAQYLGKGVNWLKSHGLIIPDYFGNLMRRIGGGEKALIRARHASPELIASRSSFREAEKARNLALQRLRDAWRAERSILKIIRKLGLPKSARGKRILNDARQKVEETRKDAMNAILKSLEAKKAFNEISRQVTNDALRQVRNKGIKRTLKTTGLVGGLGTGAYLVIPRNSELLRAVKETPLQYRYSPRNSELLRAVKETPLQYRYSPNNGWQEWNQGTGLYENQQQGFGIDRYGNTNYYDGINWLTPDQYLQGSNGYIYNKQTGQFIGIADDTREAHNHGYDSVFDYRAAKAGYNSLEAVKQLQKRLGINVDGKWGRQTLDAFDRAASNLASQ